MVMFNPETLKTTVAINVFVLDARELTRIEKKIEKHGNIITQLYIKSLDKNMKYQIRSATYIVETDKPRNLRRTFTQLKNHESTKSKIYINI